MDSSKPAPTTIDEYIAGFPAEIQEKLRAMRATIHAAAPEATEKISYAMPTFFLQGNLVHFAAFKNHIGFFPAPSGIEKFAQALERYQTSKGTIQFPLSEPLPLDLVTKVTEFRVQENLARAKAKKK
jgi:uncharacterized protein YdhG (YjbR/CyaY superfamily)